MECVNYIFIIQSFDQLYDIAKERKETDYKQYLGMLLHYLYGFCHHIKPLLDLNVELNILKADFEEKFDKGKFSEWPRETGGALTNTGAHLDLSAFSCPEELASLGLDRLKSSLMVLGLKCGGTLDGRAVRLFSTKGNLFDKTKPGKGVKKDTEELKEVALMETQVYRFAEMSDEEEEEEPVMIFLTTLRTCPWAGMASRSRTGCTSCTVST